MTKIAVLSDIHGNVPAMEAVLADLDRCVPDEVLVGGDLVGRGPEGSKVVQRIRALGWPGVRGNHEDYLLGFRRQTVPDSWQEAEEWSAARWMSAELDDDDVRYIDSLPFTIHSRFEPELRLVHASPRSNNEGLGPWMSDDELERQLARVEEPLIVCAHTHRPMLRRLSGGLIVNVGAVGLPFNRDTRAQYAILHKTAAGWEVDFRQVEYDIERTRAIYRSSGFLAEGGATARLLELELQHATPFLVPFIKWARTTQRPETISQMDAFLRVFDPDEPIHEFFGRLNERGGPTDDVGR